MPEFETTRIETQEEPTQWLAGPPPPPPGAAGDGDPAAGRHARRLGGRFAGRGGGAGGGVHGPGARSSGGAEAEQGLATHTPLSSEALHSAAGHLGAESPWMIASAGVVVALA